MNARRSIRNRPHGPFPIKKRNPLRRGSRRKSEGKFFGVCSGAITHLGLLWIGNNCDVMEINGHRLLLFSLYLSQHLLSESFGKGSDKYVVARNNLITSRRFRAKLVEQFTGFRKSTLAGDEQRKQTNAM